MTAIEYMQKQLRKCEINLEREEQRGASEEVLQAIRDKIRFYGEAVGAADVTRCKDCVHYKTQNKSPKWNHTAMYCMRAVTLKMNPDDFCSRGERRKDGADG